MANCICFSFECLFNQMVSPLNGTSVTPALLFFSYLLNPYTVMSCVAKSTCAINNTVIAFFILATIKGNALKNKWFLMSFCKD